MAYADEGASGGYWVRQWDGPVLATWLGCVGDGSTDNLTTLATAINFVNDNGLGELRLPAGDYYVSDSITFEDLLDIVISGDGQDATVIYTDTFQNPLTAGVLLRVDGATDVTIKDLAIRGDTASATTAAWALLDFHTEDAENVTIERVKFSDARKYALEFNSTCDPTNIRIKDCMFVDCGTDSSVATGGALGCGGDDSDYGFYVDGTAFINCGDSSNEGWWAAYLEDMPGIIVRDCTFDGSDNERTGLKLTGERALVTGNNFSYSLNLFLSASGNAMEVHGNTFDYCEIRVDDDISFRDNLVLGPMGDSSGSGLLTYEISAYTATDGAVFENNTFWDLDQANTTWAGYCFRTAVWTNCRWINNKFFNVAGLNLSTTGATGNLIAYNYWDWPAVTGTTLSGYYGFAVFFKNGESITGNRMIGNRVEQPDASDATKVTAWGYYTTDPNEMMYEQWGNSGGTAYEMKSAFDPLFNAVGSDSDPTGDFDGSDLSYRGIERWGRVGPGEGDNAFSGNDAAVGWTDQDGGTVRIEAGRSTGTGTGKVEIYTVPAQGTGSTWGTKTLSVTVEGDGDLTLNRGDLNIGTNNIVNTIVALTAADTTIDFDEGALQTLDMGGDLTFGTAANKAAGKMVELFVTNDQATNCVLTLNASWKHHGEISPITVPNGDVVAVTLRSLGTAETDVHCATSLQNN